MSGRRPRRLAAGAIAAALMLAGCLFEPDATPTPSLTPTVAPTASPPPSATPSATEPATAEPTPTATADPALGLELPDETDERRVRVDVAVDLPADGDGRIVVTVASEASSMVEELVLRWPEELHETLFPAPFVPSSDRIREGGEPLVQPWTKWVIGPGERGEPAGTVSLGYGPLLAGATLEIPLFVTRRAEGPVAFDLQLLAGNAILSLDDDQPAVLRVEVP